MAGGPVPEGAEIPDPESSLVGPTVPDHSHRYSQPTVPAHGWEGGSGHRGLSSETGLSGQGSQVPLREGALLLLALSLPRSAVHQGAREERQLQKATLCRFLATHRTTRPVAERTVELTALPITWHRGDLGLCPTQGSWTLVAPRSGPGATAGIAGTVRLSPGLPHGQLVPSEPTEREDPAESTWPCLTSSLISLHVTSEFHPGRQEGPAVQPPATTVCVSVCLGVQGRGHRTLLGGGGSRVEGRSVKGPRECVGQEILLWPFLENPICHPAPLPEAGGRCPLQ